MSKQTKRYSLNTNQIQLLKTLYRFRFITSNFLATYKHINRFNSRKSLEVLKDQDYIASHYDSSYKLLGKGARYYLTTKGLKYLRENTELNQAVLHAMYKNKSVTDGFVDHCVAANDVYLTFRDSYPGTFKIFTRSDNAEFDYFPDPRPDLFLDRLEPATNQTNEYFIEFYHDKLLGYARKRFDALLQHYEDGEWGEDDYPTLCFVLADTRNENAFVAYVQKMLDSNGMDDEIRVLTTSIKALLMSPEATEIWTDVLSPNDLISL